MILRRHRTIPRPLRVRGPAIGVLLVVLISACASADRLVDRRMILPQNAVTHELNEDEFFIMAVPIETPDPEFPERALQPEPGGAARICATFVVAEDGSVEGEKVISDPVECPDSLTEEYSTFADAVLQAISGWSYFGAAICTRTRGHVADETCERPGSTLKPVSIRLMYVFEFEETQGRRSVSSLRR